MLSDLLITSFGPVVPNLLSTVVLQYVSLITLILLRSTPPLISPQLM